MSIVIIDYGSGNLRSVEKAFQKFGFPATVSKDRAAIRAASGLVLPGVGSFDAAIKELKEAGLEVIIEEAIALGKPFLGICLGMQHLFESSEEGELKGLGLFKGSVKKFKLDKGYSVPHMGWNRLLIKKPAPIFEGIENGNMVYFAHSYYVVPTDDSVIAS
ncbi:MAG: imidazole glycerol phosphate synthase subunit HisH, partial [bacterium]